MKKENLIKGLPFLRTTGDPASGDTAKFLERPYTKKEERKKTAALKTA